MTDPETEATITLKQLTEAVHLVRHEHGQFWPVSDYCGCRDWAQTIWDLTTKPGLRAAREALRVPPNDPAD